MAGGSPPGASVVSRVLAVLDAFSESRPRLSLSDLSEATGLPAPTVLRLVRQLMDGGALIRDAQGRYAIGQRLWSIGLLASVEGNLREAASPFLHDLHAATRATVHLAVRDGESALYLDRLAGHASVSVVSREGSRLPLYATAVGKVLLADAPDELVHHVLCDLRPITAYTITAPGILRRQLQRVRAEGLATTKQEMSLGAHSLAVPVTLDAQVIAALGVVVTDLGRHQQRLATGLKVAAEGIARTLRHEPFHRRRPEHVSTE